MRAALAARVSGGRSRSHRMSLSVAAHAPGPGLRRCRRARDSPARLGQVHVEQQAERHAHENVQPVALGLHERVHADLARDVVRRSAGQHRHEQKDERDESATPARHALADCPARPRRGRRHRPRFAERTSAPACRCRPRRCRCCPCESTARLCTQWNWPALRPLRPKRVADHARSAAPGSRPCCSRRRRCRASAAGVGRDVDVPGRAVAERVAVEEELLHERAVLLEHLDAVVDPVADVDQPVVGDAHAVHRVAELQCRRLRPGRTGRGRRRPARCRRRPSAACTGRSGRRRPARACSGSRRRCRPRCCVGSTSMSAGWPSSGVPFSATGRRRCCRR